MKVTKAIKIKECVTTKTFYMESAKLKEKKKKAKRLLVTASLANITTFVLLMVKRNGTEGRAQQQPTN